MQCICKGIGRNSTCKYHFLRVSIKVRVFFFFFYKLLIFKFRLQLSDHLTRQRSYLCKSRVFFFSKKQVTRNPLNIYPLCIQLCNKPTSGKIIVRVGMCFTFVPSRFPKFRGLKCDGNIIYDTNWARQIIHGQLYEVFTLRTSR